MATARNGIEALSLVHQHKPDFAFLDIRMPGLNGLQMAESLQQTRAAFVTAFDEYATATFERAATDCLRKPVSDERLKKCIDRLRQQLQPDPTVLAQCLAGLQSDKNKLLWFHVGLANQTRLVALDEGLFFQASDKYTELVTAHERHVIRTPLNDVKNDDDKTVLAWQDQNTYRINAFKKQSSDQNGVYRIRFFATASGIEIKAGGSSQLLEKGQPSGWFSLQNCQGGLSINGKTADICQATAGQSFLLVVDQVKVLTMSRS